MWDSPFAFKSHPCCEVCKAPISSKSRGMMVMITTQRRIGEDIVVGRWREGKMTRFTFVPTSTTVLNSSSFFIERYTVPLGRTVMLLRLTRILVIVLFEKFL
jgi:hypothetical protein